MASASRFATTFIFLLILLSTSSAFASSASTTISEHRKMKFSTQTSLLNHTENSQQLKTPLLKKKPVSSTKNSTKLTKPNKTDLDETAIAPKTTNTIPKQPNSIKQLHSLNPNNKRLNLDAQNTPKDNTNKPSTPMIDIDDITLDYDLSDLQSLLPDFDILSASSKAYISAAHRGLAEGVAPLVGQDLAPKLAPFLSSLSLLVPTTLLITLFRHLRAQTSRRRHLVLVQAYLALYFGTLAAAALAAGLDPVRALYAASPSWYACAQALQALTYLVYLVAQLADLVVLFGGAARDSGRALGLAQMVVGLGVGVHYYVVVFARAARGKAPLGGWRVHAVYCVCFVVVFLCARAERRKKGYEEDECGKLS